jgi:hypothetical protein
VGGWPPDATTARSSPACAGSKGGPLNLEGEVGPSTALAGFQAASSSEALPRGENRSVNLVPSPERRDEFRYGRVAGGPNVKVRTNLNGKLFEADRLRLTRALALVTARD